MRAPEAPIGWPSATAPPLTFTDLRVGVEQLDGVERDRAERLVDLDALDVPYRLPGALERLIPGAAGRPREIRELVGDVAVGDDRREHLEPALLREPLARDDERSRPRR